MNALAVINAARALLTPLGHPVHVGDTLDTNAAGLLKLPTDASQFVLHTILGAPEHQWGTTRYAVVTVQVDAFSRTEGEPLAMLALAQPALTAGKFIPGALTRLGRDGPYTGYAQRFERTA